MSLAQNKTIVRRFLEEVYNQRNPAVTDHYADASSADHLKGVLAFNLVLSAFPDARLTIEHMIAEREHVTVLSTFSGTHRGEFMSVPPTGKGVTGRVAFNFRLTDGTIVESWAEFEPWGLMQQVGAPPYSPTAKPGA
jgi:predicted ester cyclase